MTDPYERLQRLQDEQKSKSDIQADPWKPLLALLGIVLFGIVFMNIFVRPVAEAKLLDRVLEFCRPSPTDECVDRVTAAHEECLAVRDSVHSVRSNRESFYWGCLYDRIPGMSKKVKGPSGTPGLTLGE